MEKMNKIFIVAGLLSLSALTSCDNEKFLTTPQYTLVASDAMFENDENAKKGMSGIYDMMLPNGSDDGGQNTDGEWGLKPNLFTGCHPTMDTQATGWDKDFLTQSWTADNAELNKGWYHAYHALSRCNGFLEGLENATAVSESVKKTLEGEARACRAFFYIWLAQTFGRVPMLATGETYTTNPDKERAKDYAEMWDFIIDDLEHAADLLDWKPLDNQLGRATKGMALAFLGDAYMWKAYRCPETKAENLQKAITVYRQIMNSGVYKLNPCFAANWDPAGAWNPEVIWAEVLDEGSNWNGWSNRTAFMMLKWFVGCTENGGWGTEFLSWEWYSCYEKGDKRRDASCATGPVKCWEYGDVVDDDGNVVEGRVKEIEDPWKVVDKTSAVYGYNPYLQQKLGKYKADGTLSPISQVPQYHCLANGEPAPSIWTTKLWRTARSDGDSWGYGVWAPISIYWKRLPNVMLDLAECLFETQGGDCAEAWDLINQLRERAFGNLESSLDVSRYIAHYNTIASHYGTEQLTTYPIPLNTQKVEVPDAKEYYTKLHDTPNRVGYTHTSPVWKIAVNEERRKEFNSEWCLRPDMQKSGYMADHIEYNYPIDNHPSDYASMRNYPWTARTFTYQESKMDMPIPSDELLRNSLCDQNPGY